MLKVNTLVKNEYKEYLGEQHGADNYLNFKHILYSKNDSLVKQVIQRVRPILTNIKKERISICDIGAGDGFRISQIIKYFSDNKGFNLKLDFIEQSPVFCSYFDKYRDSINRACEISIFNDLFETCFDYNKKYDIIFLIHSIFCLDQENLIDKLLSSLNENGHIIVVSNSANSILANIKKETDIAYSDKRFEIDDLKADLNTQKIPYQPLTFTTEWFIPKCQIDNDLNIILNWLSLGKYEEYDHYDQMRIKDKFLSFSTYQHDLYFFKEKEETLIIPKN